MTSKTKFWVFANHFGPRVASLKINVSSILDPQLESFWTRVKSEEILYTCSNHFRGKMAINSCPAPPPRPSTG